MTNGLKKTVNFQIGQLVKNFGHLGRITGFHEVTGELILTGRSLSYGGKKWLADPEKCEPFSEYNTDTAFVHKNQLAFN